MQLGVLWPRPFFRNLPSLSPLGKCCCAQGLPERGEGWGGEEGDFVVRTMTDIKVAKGSFVDDGLKPDG